MTDPDLPYEAHPEATKTVRDISTLLSQDAGCTNNPQSLRKTSMAGRGTLATFVILLLIFSMMHNQLSAQTWLVIGLIIAGFYYQYLFSRVWHFTHLRLLRFALPATLFASLLIGNPTCVIAAWSWAGGCVLGILLFSAAHRGALNRLRRAMIEPGWHIDGERVPDDQVAVLARTLLDQLDGTHRFWVSITNGPARLDIAGNRDVGVMVCCSPDAGDRSSWFLAKNSARGDQLVRVSVGQGLTHLPARDFVSVEYAQQALKTFVERHRIPDPSLEWRQGEKAFTGRPRCLRQFDPIPVRHELDRSHATASPGSEQPDLAADQSRQSATACAVTTPSQPQGSQSDVEIPGMLPVHGHHRHPKVSRNDWV